MSDELDVLRHDNEVKDPDPQFRAELMDRLRHVMATGVDVAPTALALSRVASTDTDGSHLRRPLRWAAVVAVAACLFAMVAVAAVVLSDRETVESIDPAETPTTSPASATIDQYGRVVSEHSAAIQDWITREESSDHVEDTFPQYVRERYLELRPLLAEFDRTLADLPPPPGEIAPLVDETKQQIRDALDSVHLLLGCGADSPFTPCADERSEADAAYKALPSLFEAWRPYT